MEGDRWKEGCSGLCGMLGRGRGSSEGRAVYCRRGASSGTHLLADRSELLSELLDALVVVLVGDLELLQ